MDNLINRRIKDDPDPQSFNRNICKLYVLQKMPFFSEHSSNDSALMLTAHTDTILVGGFPEASREIGHKL